MGGVERGGRNAQLNWFRRWKAHLLATIGGFPFADCVGWSCMEGVKFKIECLARCSGSCR